MKKFFVAILIILAITLTACSSSSVGTPIGSTSNDLPIVTQLAVGTLKLEGTDQDISVDQAEELVAYWQLYQDLTQSGTAAQEEVDAVIAQIQETMTTEQIQAITDMQITQQDVSASVQGLTVVSSNSSDSTGSVPSSSAGGPPADGGAPPDGGGMPLEMGGAASVSGTDQTQSAQTSSGLEGTTGVPSALVEAVIRALQEKIAA